jgi:hypothetical protein
MSRRSGRQPAPTPRAAPPRPTRSQRLDRCRYRSRPRRSDRSALFDVHPHSRDRHAWTPKLAATRRWLATTIGRGSR